MSKTIRKPRVKYPPRYAYYARAEGPCKRPRVMRWWVSSLPHRKGSRAAMLQGVDWGFSVTEGAFPSGETWDKPILLSDYWQRRFAADCRFLGRSAVFVEG